MNEQQRKIIDYVDSQQIDWSKPVEYERAGIVYEVLHTFVLKGVRYVVLQHPAFGMTHPDDLIIREVNDSPGEFRNMRRKMKHSAKYWLIAFATGEFVATHDEKYVKNLTTMQGYRKGCCVVTEHVHEW